MIAGYFMSWKEIDWPLECEQEIMVHSCEQCKLHQVGAGPQ